MMRLFTLLDSGSEEFHGANSVPGMDTGGAVQLFGVTFGAAAMVIAAWREYRHRRLREPGLHFGAYAAPAARQAEATAPAAPRPAQSPVPSGPSVAPATASARTQLAPRRSGGTYVRRAAPKRSTATRQKLEDKPS